MLDQHLGGIHFSIQTTRNGNNGLAHHDTVVEILVDNFTFESLKASREKASQQV